MKKFVDYYDQIKELDERDGKEFYRSKNRQDNLKILTELETKWRAVPGAKADEILKRVREAVPIFSDEAKYKEWDKKFVEHYKKELEEGYIKHLVSGNALTKKEANTIIEAGKRKGLTTNEVNNFLVKEKHLRVVEDQIPFPTRPQKRRIPKLICSTNKITFKGVISKNIIKIGTKKKGFNVENKTYGTLEATFDTTDDAGLLDVKPYHIKSNYEKIQVKLNTVNAEWGKSYSEKIIINGNASNCPVEIPVTFKIWELKKFLIVVVAFFVLVGGISLPTILHKPSKSQVNGPEYLISQADHLFIQNTSTSLEEASRIYKQILNLNPSPDPSYIKHAKKKLSDIKIIYINWAEDALPKYREAIKWLKKAQAIDPIDTAIAEKIVDYKIMLYNQGVKKES